VGDGADARIRRAFCELLRHRPVSRITVVDVTERAKVSRTTFYHHYLDTRDLRDRLQRETLEAMSKIHALAPYLDLSQFSTREPVPIYAEGYRYVAEHADVYLALFGPFRDPVWVAEYRQMVKDNLALGLRRAGIAVPNKDLVLAYVVGGLEEQMLAWLRETPRRSVEEISAAATLVMRQNLAPERPAGR